MMVDMGTDISDIASMPRGGPDASWLDRHLQTDRLEYLDRDDVDHLKHAVIASLDRFGKLFGHHESFARMALDEVAGVAEPNIIELGSGHGALSQALLDLHPTARVTVTDVEPSSVAAIAEGDLGDHPRATVREVDATAIDAPDSAYHLAVFAMAFHHLPPELASRVIAEGTRVADKLLIIDLPRPASVLHLIQLATMLPLALVLPMLHDGFISSLRAYSGSALATLARHADPEITVELRGGGLFNTPLRPRPQIMVATRH